MAVWDSSLSDLGLSYCESLDIGGFSQSNSLNRAAIRLV